MDHMRLQFENTLPPHFLNLQMYFMLGSSREFSYPKQTHCQTHHLETGTKCPDFCLDSEENGLFCHLWFLKQHCLLLLLLLNRRLQLQLKVKLHQFSETDLGYCSRSMVVAKKIQKKKKWYPSIQVFDCKPGSVLKYLITQLCTAL